MITRETHILVYNREPVKPKEQNLPEHLIVFQVMENLVDIYGIRKLISVFSNTIIK
jgi:hypothetical protein